MKTHGIQEKDRDIHLSVIRHLNLERNRFKVFEGFQKEFDYSKHFNHELDDLTSFVGTHLIGRIDNNKITYSVFRLYNDYSATLEHPVVAPGEKLKCLLSVFPINNYHKAFFVEVFSSKSSDPIIVVLLRLPLMYEQNYNNLSRGKYIGLGSRTPIGGDTVFYKINAAADHQDTVHIPQVLSLDEVPNFPAYNMILEILLEGTK